jgi:hypothetical protein
MPRIMRALPGQMRFFPVLNAGQLAALRAVGGEWDQVSAAPAVWSDDQRAGQQLALRPEAVSVPAQRPAPVAPRGHPRRTTGPKTGPADVMRMETAEHPEQISVLTIIPLLTLDRASMRALA